MLRAAGRAYTVGPPLDNELSQQVNNNTLPQRVHIPLLKVHCGIAAQALSKLKREDTAVRAIELLWNLLLIAHVPA